MQANPIPPTFAGIAVSHMLFFIISSHALHLAIFMESIFYILSVHHLVILETGFSTLTIAVENAHGGAF